MQNDSRRNAIAHDTAGAQARPDRPGRGRRTPDISRTRPTTTKLWHYEIDAVRAAAIVAA